MRLALYHVPSPRFFYKKRDNKDYQVVEIRENCSKCIFSGTRKSCEKFMKEHGQ